MNQLATADDPVSAFKPHVLVVEDIDTTRRRIVDTLRGNGYDVAEAVDGRDALEKVSAARFDAILLDLVLPHVNGWQFREAQLRHPELANIPTVVITARPLSNPARYVLRADHVVNKPFEDDVLLAAVGQACKLLEASGGPPSNPTSHLFWSRHGEVACWTHAPSSDPVRWRLERWAVIREGAGSRRLVYQCQHCPGRTGPVKRTRRPRPSEAPITEAPTCPKCQAVMDSTVREARTTDVAGDGPPPRLMLKVWRCHACEIDRPRFDL